MPNNNLERLLHKNLLYTIHAAVGSEIFKHIYVRDVRDGNEFDALDDGSNACAYVASGILALHGLINHPHATVASTIEYMLEAGWVSTEAPQSGDIVQWGGLEPGGRMHMAFYMGENKVIGNSTTLRMVAEYGLTLPDGREPIAFYTHPDLRTNSSQSA